jgi:serine/threonine protein kinase
MLGQGTYSTVYNHTDTSVKKVWRHLYDYDWLLELAILRQVIHPNLISLEDYSLQPLFILMPKATCTLQTALGVLAPITLQNIFKQLLSAIIYLHDLQIWHGDIKPANILLFDQGQLLYFRACLCDFSGSCYGSRGTIRKGTYMYSSPEVLQGSTNCDSRLDIWSLAVTICESYKPYSFANDLLNPLPLLSDWLSHAQHVADENTHQRWHVLQYYPPDLQQVIPLMLTWQTYRQTARNLSFYDYFMDTPTYPCKLPLHTIQRRCNQEIIQWITEQDYSWEVKFHGLYLYDQLRSKLTTSQCKLEIYVYVCLFIATILRNCGNLHTNWLYLSQMTEEQWFTSVIEVVHLLDGHLLVYTPEDDFATRYKGSAYSLEVWRTWQKL